MMVGHNGNTTGRADFYISTGDLELTIVLLLLCLERIYEKKHKKFS
jgi:hypothetical protein